MNRAISHSVKRRGLPAFTLTALLPPSLFVLIPSLHIVSTDDGDTFQSLLISLSDKFVFVLI